MIQPVARGFAERRDGLLEAPAPGEILRVPRLDRQRDRQPGSDRRHRSQVAQQRLEHPGLEVDDEPFAQHHRGRVRFPTGVDQRRGQRLVGEVGGDERDVRGVDRQALEPESLVALGGGMVDLEPSHSRLGVAQRPSVVSGADRRHLEDVPRQRVHDHSIEERRAPPQVPPHGLVLVEAERTGHVARQALVGVGIAERRRQALVAEAIGGDPLRGGRRLALTHLPGLR